MGSLVSIDAGVCGFRTDVKADCEDGQFVTFEISTGCEKIATVAQRLKEKGPIDAFQEISPVSESVVLGTVRAVLKGCCAGCGAPVGIFKAMQVAAGLALPQDVIITIRKE
jgi:hypothetical protein